MTSQYFDKSINDKSHLKTIQADSEDQMLDLLLADFADRDDELIPILTGPTASGKSSLALRWCQQEKRELISADSMQIYRGFDIGTAKPDLYDQEVVRHHLIDIRDADQDYSVAQFISDATSLLEQGREKGQKYLICGGSGQYISALVEGIRFNDPAPDRELRLSVEKKIRERGVNESYELLRKLDPLAAEQIAPQNIRRIQRFFEKLEISGKTLTELNRESLMDDLPFNFCVYQLNWQSREELYSRINTRSEQMFNSGLVEETRDLIRKYPDVDSAPAFRGISYRESVQLIRGELTEAEARENTARASRRYAKRQLTWFRPKNYVNKLEYLDK